MSWVLVAYRGSFGCLLVCLCLALATCIATAKPSQVDGALSPDFPFSIYDIDCPTCPVVECVQLDCPYVSSATTIPTNQETLNQVLAHEAAFEAAIDEAYHEGVWKPQLPLVFAHLVNWFDDCEPLEPGVQWIEATRHVPYQGYYDMSSIPWLKRSSDIAKRALLTGFGVSWFPEGLIRSRMFRNGTEVYEGMSKFMSPVKQYASEVGNTPIIALIEMYMVLPNYTCILAGWKAQVMRPKFFDMSWPAQITCGDAYLAALKNLVEWFPLPGYYKLPPEPNGLPRPVVYLYLARQAHDAASFLKEFRAYSISKGFNPYIIADVIWWNPGAINIGSTFWSQLLPLVDCLTGYNLFDADLGSIMGDVPYIENRQFELSSHFFTVAKAASLDFMPAVSPGYDDAVYRGPRRPVQSRANATQYQTEWVQANAFIGRSKSNALPFVFLRSFNEWVEGTQIEPSRTDGGFFVEETRRQILQSGLLMSTKAPSIFGPIPQKAKPPSSREDCSGFDYASSLPCNSMMKESVKAIRADEKIFAEKNEADFLAAASDHGDLPIVLAHTCLWFGDSSPDPGVQWGQPSRNTPLGGRYLSTDKEWAHKASIRARDTLITAFAVSWFPRGQSVWALDEKKVLTKTSTDGFILSFLDNYMNETVDFRLPVVALIETLMLSPNETCLLYGWDHRVPDSFGPDPEKIISCGTIYVRALLNLLEEWFPKPLYYKLPPRKGSTLPRPVVFLYLARYGHHSTRYLEEFRKQAKDQGFDPYIIGDLVWWNQPDHPNGPHIADFDCIGGYNSYNWPLGPFQEDPLFMSNANFNNELQYYAVAKKLGLDFMPSVSPGYDDSLLRGSDRPVQPRNNGSFYELQWSQAHAFIGSSKTNPVPLVFLRSWNEWIEGTEIEPSEEYGDFYLNETRKRILESRVFLKKTQPSLMS